MHIEDLESSGVLSGSSEELAMYTHKQWNNQLSHVCSSPIFLYGMMICCFRSGYWSGRNVYVIATCTTCVFHCTVVSWSCSLVHYSCLVYKGGFTGVLGLCSMIKIIIDNGQQHSHSLCFPSAQSALVAIHFLLPAGPISIHFLLSVHNCLRDTCTVVL